MADLAAALPFVLAHEGGYSNHPSDKGGETKYGVTERVARDYGYTGPMQDLPMSVVEAIYRQGYWRFDGIRDQRVATKIFDCCVNLGLKGGVKILQRTLVAMGHFCVVDGEFGPKTLQMVNEADPNLLLQGLIYTLKGKYLRIVDEEPSQQVFLKGWIRRAEDLP